MEPPRVVVVCDRCGGSGYAGAQIVPYSVAPGIEAWLCHWTCSSVTLDAAWREEFARARRAAAATPALNDQPEG